VSKPITLTVVGHGDPALGQKLEHADRAHVVVGDDGRRRAAMTAPTPDWRRRADSPAA
jgi:hypothetical protein